MTTCIVCVGGGRGERFGGEKLAVDLGGRSVLEHALLRLRAALPDAPLFAVLPADRLEAWRTRLAASMPDLTVVPGGPRRQDSVRHGIDAAPPGCDVVVVHDAARPLVDPADVRSALAALTDGVDGVVLCGPVVDTVKRVDAGGRVLATLPRAELRLAQTPQVVRSAALRHAFATAPPAEYTDEAALLEAVGRPVVTVLAGSPNPKLTHPADLPLLRRLAEEAW